MSASSSASTPFRVSCGILAKALLAGAKTVRAGALFSESTRPASFTAPTRVDSTGFPDAAVATGTLAMAVKLPGFDASVGTAAQPAPNCWPEDIAGAIDGAAIDGAAAGAAACPIGPEPPLPHADRARANTAPAVTVTNREWRMDVPFRAGRMGPRRGGPTS